MIQTLKEEGKVYDLTNNKKIEKLIIKANRIVVKGLTINNIVSKGIRIEGDYVTLEKCNFIGNTGSECIMISGQFCRITNCLFENFEEKGCAISIRIKKSRPSYCLIDNNNFRDCLKSYNNGAEMIRIGDSRTSLYSCKSIIYNNFFSRCNREIELISVKSCDNIICYNKVIECESGISLRHGKRNLVKYNYINGNHNENCVGIRMNDEGHMIYNNTLEGIITDENPFRTAISIQAGQENNKLNGYAPSKNIKIRDNNILSCDIAFSIGVNNKSNSNIKPNNISIMFNKIVKCLKEINDDDKCLGADKLILKNDIINKDVKINIYKAEDLVDTPNMIQELYVKLYVDKYDINEEKQVKDNKKEEVKEEIKEDDKGVEEFEDILEKLDFILDDFKNKEECLTCENYIKEMNIMKSHYDNMIERMKKEIDMYKKFFNNIKDRFT